MHKGGLRTVPAGMPYRVLCQEKYAMLEAGEGTVLQAEQTQTQKAFH